MKPINAIVLLCCLTIGQAWAQPTYKVALPIVDADAFYAIDLPHQVLGATRTDFADIRIKNSENQEIAWLLKEDIHSDQSSEFVPFQTTVTSAPHRTNILITTDSTPLSSFILKIKNADVKKKATLSGSNDNKRWFVVKDRFLLSNISNNSQTEALLNLTFPLSDYKYYKMDISDSLSAPLNIMEAGRMKDENYHKRNLLEVPLQSIRIEQQGKQTEIHLVYPFKYQIDRLAFFISSPRFFSRDLRVEFPYVASVGTLSHQNGMPQIIPVEMLADTLQMSIFNGDDQPLVIDSIKSYIRKFYLVSALKKGDRYTLTYGEKDATFPQYDLSFEQQISDSIPHLQLGKIEQITGTEEQPESSSLWLYFLKTYGIWLIIVVVILQILVMVKKLMK
ncbi:hypothetical protein [Bacteroides sp.]|uniref:hypothetical protein n=1 Tax=Bacteroides sp. TaxID=29523 RepID=UPI0026181F62|nr:hypothetical protein [Bacteroides sp.]